MNTEEKDLEFFSKELQEKYLVAKDISAAHLAKLDRISVDIRRLEFFLVKSGFGEFAKTYKTSPNYQSGLAWDTKKLIISGGTPLIETKVKTRLEMYPFLPDFLESIALHHKEGGKNEEN